jgi:hypothetical protein
MNYTAEIECCNCGVVFLVSERLHLSWRRTKQTFYCPNGHGQSYTKSTAAILEERLAKKDEEIQKLQKELLRHQKPPRKRRGKRTSATMDE